jgi:hypothetical protein
MLSKNSSFLHHIQTFAFIIAAERLALPAAGGTRFAYETEKTQSHKKSQFGGENPAVRVHAVLLE